MTVYKFNDYISSDIKDKKVVLDLLPKNTRNRQLKFNETLIEISQEYNMYKEAMAKFITYKFEKLKPQVPFINTTNEESRINELDRIMTLGNPITSYFEKLELDILLYDLVHYYNFSITDINKTIKKIINKFKDIGITLTPYDFRLNPYEYVYMSYIFKEIANGSETKLLGNNYERIYWKCSKVFEYLIINIRYLITKYKKRFIKYADTRYKALLKENHIETYSGVMYEIKRNYEIIAQKTKITEYDFINDVIAGKIDPNYYTSNSEERLHDISTFMIRKVFINNPLEYNKMLDKIRSLRYNLREYSDYLEDAELIGYFFKKYKDYVKPKEQDSKNKKKTKKEKYIPITIDYKQLWKLSGTKFYETLEELEKNYTTIDNDLQFKQNNVLDIVYKQMNDSDNDYFDHQVKLNIKENTSIAELFHIICSYRYFTRRIIKDVFDITSNEKEKEANEKLDHIKKMLYNPERKIIDSIPAFINVNIPQILMNSYRFENIDILDTSFELGSLMGLMQKLDKILLYYDIQGFNISIDESIFIKKVTALQTSKKL